MQPDFWNESVRFEGICLTIRHSIGVTPTRASIFLVYSPPEMNIRTYPKVPQIEEKFSGEPTGYSGDPQIHPVGRASAIGLNIRIFDSEFIGF